MKLVDCLENEAFNELINFSFGEVRNLLNQFIHYVPFVKEEAFISEASAVKVKYEEELMRIEKYTKEEYTELVNSGVEIPEFDEPAFMVQDLEIQIQSQLIGLIRKYFDKDEFVQHRSELYGQEIFKEESIETPHELWVSLNVHKNHTYSLLSMLGYYQRHCRYFLSSTDYFKICEDYSRQVYRMNKKLGLEYGFINIFLSDKRLDRKYIDIDKLSLIGLLQPYLKHNTHEINRIIEIMMKNLRGGFGGPAAWTSAKEEVNQFIAECEAKGIMKRLY